MQSSTASFLHGRAIRSAWSVPLRSCFKGDLFLTSLDWFTDRRFSSLCICAVVQELEVTKLENRRKNGVSCSTSESVSGKARGKPYSVRPKWGDTKETAWSSDDEEEKIKKKPVPQKADRLSKILASAGGEANQSKS